VLIDPLDSADLAAGMRRVLCDEGFAEACRGHGLARAGCYRWSETAARAHDAYTQAVARRRALRSR
jgi:hypothetical protein